MKKLSLILGMFISIILVSCNQAQEENSDDVVCICNPEDCKEGKCDPNCKMYEKGSCHNSDKKNCNKKCDTKECPKEKCEKICDTKECPKEMCDSLKAECKKSCNDKKED